MTTERKLIGSLLFVDSFVLFQLLGYKSLLHGSWYICKEMMKQNMSPPPHPPFLPLSQIPDATLYVVQLSIFIKWVEQLRIGYILVFCILINSWVACFKLITYFFNSIPNNFVIYVVSDLAWLMYLCVYGLWRFYVTIYKGMFISSLCKHCIL